MKLHTTNDDITSGLHCDNVISLLTAGNLKTLGYWWHHLWIPFGQVRSGLASRL